MSMLTAAERTAYHEASHAVVADELGVPFRCIALGRAPGDEAGWLTPDPQDVWSIEDPVRQLMRELVVAAAGYAASRRVDFSELRAWDRAGGDRAAMKSLASLIGRLRGDPNNHEAQRKLVAQGFELAEEVLDRPLVWGKVSAVAEHLLAEGFLTQSQVSRTIQHATPAWALS